MERGCFRCLEQALTLADQRNQSPLAFESAALLVLRATELGANAVIGIDLDYEVLGQNNGMLMVSVSGTAVVC